MTFTRRAALLLLVGIAFFAACSKEEEGAGAMKAPAFALLTADGQKTISLSDYKGKVLILNFWATWCPPCKREIPHFNELYEQYKGEGLEILGVSVDQGGAAVVQEFLKSDSGSLIPRYPVVIANREVATVYGPIASIPVTFVIDRKGNVQQRLIGYQDKETSEAIIQKLL
jgi:cytochrome c biogenesis protein CcmG/thiol:disulfide interchange protein DsbE